MTGSVLQTAWWLEGGTEQCPVCLQRYAYEVEYRCVDCDAPVCPFCVVAVRRTGRAWCPGCAPEPKRRQ